MTVVRWTQGMSVGVPSIDADHQALIGMVNQLDDAIKAAKGQERFGSVLDALLDYTMYHFGREEALMEACGYPDLEAHRHTHRVLRTQVAHIRDRHSGNPDAIRDREVLAFLKNWLTSHIMGRDKLYEPFMASRRAVVQKAEAAYADRLDGRSPPAVRHGAGELA
jgi:hemerythrin